MQSPWQPKKLLLLSGACSVAAAVVLATLALSHDAASTKDWLSAGLLIIAAALQFTALLGGAVHKLSASVQHNVTAQLVLAVVG